jgi:hypothetical protein
MILLRLALFIVIVTCACVQVNFYIQLAGEVDRGVPTGTGPFASVGGLGRQRVWRTMREHRALYPHSTLRKKVWCWQVATLVSIVVFAWLW